MSSKLKSLLTSVTVVVALPAFAQDAGLSQHQAPATMSSVTAAYAAAVAQAEAFVANYDAGFDKAMAVWPDFALRETPKLIVMRNRARSISGLIALDHPNPDALGVAVPVPSQKASVFLISDPRDDLDFASLENFEFSKDIAGAPTFIIASNCEDPEYEVDCVDQLDFNAYFVHEVFHRYQDDAFRNMVNIDQNAYDYSAENIYLALLENDLLVRIDQTDDAGVLRPLVQDLVALRTLRAEHSRFVALDEAQEHTEGTARYVEDALMTNTNISATEALRHNLQSGEIKEELGFGRFYFTGAIMMRALHKLGQADATNKIEAGATPMQVLATAVPAVKDTAAAVERLKAELDPQNIVAKRAEQYAEWAATEPDIFAE